MRAQVDASQRPAATTAEKQRIKELERDVRDLKGANEILMAASTFFAAEQCATGRWVDREVVRDRPLWAVAAA